MGVPPAPDPDVGTYAELPAKKKHCSWCFRECGYPANFETMELFPAGPPSPGTSDDESDSDSSGSSVSSADSDEKIPNPKNFNSGGGNPPA